MFDTKIYKTRREQLKKQVGSGLLLFTGNEESPMNYTDNTYHFRQDSNFLYFFGMDRVGLSAIIDIDENKEIIFGDELSLDYIVWMGNQETIADQAAKVGVAETQPGKNIESYLKKAKEKEQQIHFLPPYRHLNMLKLETWLDMPVKELQSNVSTPFIKAVVAQRSIKIEEELLEMEKALVTTARMHITAMQNAKAGMTEAQLTGQVHGIAVADGGGLAYPIILTKNGHILHNHYHGNTIEKGQLILGDFGAHTERHYAGDITRTFPVDYRFSLQQREIYQLVLKAEESVIKAIQPGVPYRDMHLLSANIIATGLTEIGLMKGDPEEAVAAGAHALFFPHGLGHMIGLDVHDMEDLGEDLVGYDEEFKRSEQFGFRSLRLGRRLKPGFVLTVEPGIYFIPVLIDKWRADKMHVDFINYDALDAYRDFGGIRIEDNCVVEQSGARILGPAIPKGISEVEALRINA